MRSRPPLRVTAQHRQVHRTVLIVGEGEAEVLFLKHLRQAYLGDRSGGLRFTTKNAKGKGGKHVLDYTVRQRRVAAYDAVGSLLDTDTAWTEAEKRAARAAKITVFESSPCFEALLLQIAGLHAAANSALCKQQFERVFGHQAHDERVYSLHFSRQVLDGARATVHTLDTLLKFLGC